MTEHHLAQAKPLLGICNALCILTGLSRFVVHNYHCLLQAAVDAEANARNLRQRVQFSADVALPAAASTHHQRRTEHCHAKS